MPVLGICRGMEMLNVILRRHPQPALSDWRSTGTRPARTPITTSGSSRARSRRAVVGRERTEVKSAHHQGLDGSARVWSRPAGPTDGVVEAIELPDRSFAVGVLWHPRRTSAAGGRWSTRLAARGAARGLRRPAP